MFSTIKTPRELPDDIEQLKQARSVCNLPLIASGGAGTMEHFKDVFQQCDVDGALAASVFHKKIIEIIDLKNYLANKSFEPKIEMRLC